MDMDREEKARHAALDRIAVRMRRRTGCLMRGERFDGPRPDKGRSIERAAAGEQPCGSEGRCLDAAPRRDDEPRQAGCSSLTIASGVASRLRGLMLSCPNEETLLLVPCCDVHTAGMWRRLDIAFVDDAGRIIETHRDVGPMRRLRNRSAAAVLERFSSCSSLWFSEGDRLGVVLLGEVEA